MFIVFILIAALSVGKDHEKFSMPVYLLNPYLYSMNAAELITNHDGSIYHLNLLPQDVAPTVILVGDPGRVPMVSGYFSSIEIKKQKREFVTHTGWLKDKRITVLSTGIGTDNIDIVMNELDALVNINLETKQPKEKLTSLNVIRIGTSGSIHPDILTDEIVVSSMAAGIDILGLYYPHQKLNESQLPDWTYITKRFPFDLNAFPQPFREGITLTCPGFYGPQGRVLRIHPALKIPIDDLYKTEINGLSFTNLEMESAGIFLLSEILGHRAISFNVILAQRQEGKFSSRATESIDRLIQATLQWITAAV